MEKPSAASRIYTPPNWLDPLDWRQVFANERPVEIDVGCGKGAFLLWAAQARPESNFLGIERLLMRLRKVDKKLQRHGLSNARLIRIEASYLIAHIIPSASVTAYHIFFPDPWPKRRHRGHRLFNPVFVRELHRTLRPDGAVNVATDHAEYFEQIELVMTESGVFTRAVTESLPEEAQTDFEREFLDAGKPICRGRWLCRA